MSFISKFAQRIDDPSVGLRLIRLALGLAFFGLAGIKIWSGHSPTYSIGIETYYGLSVLELGIGCALLLRYTTIGSWVVIVFSLIAMVLAAGFQQVQCGCFGELAFAAWRVRLLVAGTLGMLATLLLRCAVRSHIESGPSDPSAARRGSTQPS